MAYYCFILIQQEIDQRAFAGTGHAHERNERRFGVSYVEPSSVLFDGIT
jgi:hypothetical protein